jgi:hypothetical protein
MPKGLLASIYKTSRLSDCTNGGVSSTADQAVAVYPGMDQVFDSEKIGCPALQLVQRFPCGSLYWTAYPIIDGEVKSNGMFGGNYVMTSDSRFPADYPIPIHDRFEN